MDEEPSEAEMSIAYQPLSNSLEDDSKSESGKKSKKMKYKNIFGKLSKIAMFYLNFTIKLPKAIRDISMISHNSHNTANFDKFSVAAEQSDHQRDGGRQVAPLLSEEKSRKFCVCGENDLHNRKVIYARTLKDLIRKGEEGILMISKVAKMYSVKRQV